MHRGVAVPSRSPLQSPPPAVPALEREQTNHVFKYFEPLDRFVRVRVSEGAPRLVLGLQEGAAAPASLDGASYRRLVVEACVPELAEELQETHLEALYGLVLDVNPELDLHRVRFPEHHEAPGAARRTRRSSDRAAFDRRLRRLASDVEDRLGQRIVGQERALRAVGRAVRRAALGWGRRGPLASLFCLGPTGTGKTELAKALAGCVGEESDLIRVDCTEYAEAHEYAKLIGAPPGYTGYAEAGILTRGLERAENTVLLFDEVEKAHGRLHDLLLQLLDEGYVTDGSGMRLDFSRCIVVLTSNVGTKELLSAADAVGFARQDLGSRERDEILQASLDARFRPEFLARLDEVVPFDPLGPEELTEVATRQLTAFAAHARRTGTVVTFARSIAPWIARQAQEAGQGARGIAHVLEREIEAPLAERCVAEGRKARFTVRLRTLFPFNEGSLTTPLLIWGLGPTDRIW